jgi:DNA-binding transcriptional LysR family regulator
MPAMLSEEPFISYVGSDDEEGIFLTRHVLGFEPRVGHRANNPVMVLSLVEAGLGVGIISSVLASAFQSRVAYRPLSGVKLRMDVTLLCREHEPEPAVVALLDLARTLAAGQLAGEPRARPGVAAVP